MKTTRNTPAIKIMYWVALAALMALLFAYRG